MMAPGSSMLHMLNVVIEVASLDRALLQPQTWLIYVGHSAYPRLRDVKRVLFSSQSLSSITTAWSFYPKRQRGGGTGQRRDICLGSVRLVVDRPRGSVNQCLRDGNPFALRQDQSTCMSSGEPGFWAYITHLEVVSTWTMIPDVRLV